VIRGDDQGPVRPRRGDTVVLADGQIGVVRSVHRAGAAGERLVIRLPDEGKVATVAPDQVVETRRAN